MDTLTLLFCAIFMLPIAGVLAAGVFWAYVWIKEGLCGVDEEEKRIIEAIVNLPKSARVVGRGTLVMDPKDVRQDRGDYLAAVKAKNEETEYVSLDQVRKNLKKSKKVKTDLVQVQNAKSKAYKVIDKATGTVVKSTKKPVKGVKVVTKTRSTIKYASKKKAEESLAKVSKSHDNNICALEDF